MHEWPTHARADSFPTMTNSRSCHAPQSRQQNFQRVADCVGVCVYVCVFAWQRRGNFNWIYATDLWYVFLRVWMRECEWDRACIYACVCLWECVESVFMYAWVGYERVWLVVRNSFWANTHAQRQRKLRGISGSISIKLQHCNAASVSPAQRYHLQLKEQRQMKTFHNFHIVSIFEAKRDALALCTGLECHEN